MLMIKRDNCRQHVMDNAELDYRFVARRQRWYLVQTLCWFSQLHGSHILSTSRTHLDRVLLCDFPTLQVPHLHVLQKVSLIIFFNL